MERTKEYPKTRTVRVAGTEYRSADEAVQHLAVSNHDHAIGLGGKYLTVTGVELTRLRELGLSPDVWVDHRGRLVCVPGK